MKEAEIKKVVREGYGKIAQKVLSGCGPVSSCCGSQDLVQNISKRIGYSDEEIKVVPEGANLGLGCGNPVALASLKKERWCSTSAQELVSTVSWRRIR